MKSEIILYQPNDAVRLEVRVENETVWLTQRQIATLFGTEVPAVSKHIKNIYSSNELDTTATVSKMEIVQQEGGRSIKRVVDVYNLDMIISVGYRVNSLNATRFRQWSNQVLKDYLLKGYAFNQRMERIEKKLYEHDEKIDLLIKSNLLPHEGLFFEGEVFDAYEFVKKLIKSATKSIILIDNYIDDSTIAMMCAKASSVSVSLFTKGISNDLLIAEKKFNAQYKGLSIKQFNLSHDRFLIIDDTDIYLFGASMKDLGKKWFGVTKMDSANISSIIARLP